MSTGRPHGPGGTSHGRARHMDERPGFPHRRHFLAPWLQIAVAVVLTLGLTLGLLRLTTTPAKLISVGLAKQVVIKQVGPATTFKSKDTRTAITRAPKGLAARDVVVSYLQTPIKSEIKCSSTSSKILDQHHGSTRLVACLSVIGAKAPATITATIAPSNQVTMITVAFSGVDTRKPVDSIARSGSETSPRVVTKVANDDVIYGEASSGRSAAARPFSGARLAATLNDAATSQVAVATHLVSARGATAPVRWKITPTSRWPAAGAVALRVAPATAPPPSPTPTPTARGPRPTVTATPSPTTASPTPTSPSPTTTSPTSTPPSGGPPAAPPVTWCENGLPASPYTSAPQGAVTVPAGNNGALFQYQLPANTTYWFAPGKHTGDSVQASDGDTFLGAPGAIMDGGNTIQYAFVGQYNDTADQNVTIKYLTIEDYASNQGGGAVNGNGNNGWTEEYDLMEYNSPGAAMMLGGDNTVSDNCLTQNGEYGFNGYSYVDETYGNTFTGGATNITFTNNDVSYNNTQKTSSGIEGGGKFWQDGNVTVTGNYFHDNIDSPGVWMDTDNAGFLVENNYISNNGGEGLMYEISYNADIVGNTFVGNAIENGPGNPGFPTGAIYISESGGNSAVASDYAGELNIQNNVFNDNWSGVILYQNSNRYVGDGQDPGTLIPPSGVATQTWINTDGPKNCPSNLTETSPIDYHSLCQWRTQNVTVQDNQFTFNPSDSIYGGKCTQANACGENGLFSPYSSTAAYPAYTVCNLISNSQGNVFSDNTYSGPWSFNYFNQGDIATWSQWTSGLTNVEGSGDNFGKQDAGSTYSS
jgi:Right handed beta helix region